MAQHFLLSAKARTLSLSGVLRMSDAEAHATFVAIRWADSDGEPYCPHCGCAEVYAYTARRSFKCKGCARQFSVTSGTIFANRKLPVRDMVPTRDQYRTMVCGLGPAFAITRVRRSSRFRGCMSASSP